MKIADMDQSLENSQRRGVAGVLGGAMDNGEYDYGKRAGRSLDLYILLAGVPETKTSYHLAGCAN